MISFLECCDPRAVYESHLCRLCSYENKGGLGDVREYIHLKKRDKRKNEQLM